MSSRISARQTAASFSIFAIIGLASGNARAAELSDNLSNVTSGTESATSNRWLAAGFTTDASTTYHLNSVTLLLANTSPGTAVLELYSDGSLEPGTLVTTLTSPASYSSTPEATTFSESGLALDAGATYWVVLRALSGTFDWAWTADNTGNGAGFDSTWDVSEDAGSAWHTHDVYPLQFRVTVNATDPIEDCNKRFRRGSRARYKNRHQNAVAAERAATAECRCFHVHIPGRTLVSL